MGICRDVRIPVLKRPINRRNVGGNECQLFDIRPVYFINYALNDRAKSAEASEVGVIFDNVALMPLNESQNLSQAFHTFRGKRTGG
jgi:hypothetical protein